MPSVEAAHTGRPVRVQLLRVPDCPLAGQVRDLLHECLRETHVAVHFEDAEGPYPSPTLLVDGVDVVTGTTPTPDTCCRLDLPTRAQILDTLNRSRP